jgi:hypothetical protein
MSEYSRRTLIERLTQLMTLVLPAAPPGKKSKATTPAPPPELIDGLATEIEGWLEEWLAAEQVELAGRVEQVEAQLDQLTKLLRQAAPTSGRKKALPPPRPALRIAVVGPMPDQFHEIQSACGDDILCIDKEGRPAFPARVDRIVLWVSKISHAWENAAIDRVGRDNIVRRRGGIKQLIDSIRQLQRSE